MKHSADLLVLQQVVATCEAHREALHDALEDLKVRHLEAVQEIHLYLLRTKLAESQWGEGPSRYQPTVSSAGICSSVSLPGCSRILQNL